MMGLYIKGIEMPMYWYECPFCSDGYCFMIQDGDDRICLVDSKKDTHRNENCPLIELPPHGRLIDESWLKETLIETLEAIRKNPKMDMQEMHLIASFVTLGEMVADAPTVIEAEGESDGQTKNNKP